MLGVVEVEGTGVGVSRAAELRSRIVIDEDVGMG